MNLLFTHHNNKRYTCIYKCWTLIIAIGIKYLSELCLPVQKLFQIWKLFNAKTRLCFFSLPAKYSTLQAVHNLHWSSYCPNCEAFKHRLCIILQFQHCNDTLGWEYSLENLWIWLRMRTLTYIIVNIEHGRESKTFHRSETHGISTSL